MTDMEQIYFIRENKNKTQELVSLKEKSNDIIPAKKWMMKI